MLVVTHLYNSGVLKFGDFVASCRLELTLFMFFLSLECDHEVQDLSVDIAFKVLVVTHLYNSGVLKFGDFVPNLSFFVIKISFFS